MAGKTVDVVIPVCHPGKSFGILLDMLKKQTVPAHKLILMQTLQENETPLDLPDAEIHTLSPEEFDHGNTRNTGLSFSDADLVLFMTQDAVPKDERLIERLAAAFGEPGVVSVYGRQLPAEDCGVLERFSRQFNYPEEGYTKSAADLPRLGIKTYFCSDVCAMYDRTVFLKLGGFTKRTIFNEDMIYAHTVISAGYRIRYASDAQVIHSHNYTGKQQFRRNFDLAVSQADHPEVFESVSSEKEGMALVKKNIAYLKEQHKLYLVFRLVYMSGMKYMGYFLGKRYRKLPESLVLKCSMNKNYWRK